LIVNPSSGKRPIYSIEYIDVKVNTNEIRGKKESELV